MRNKSLAMRTVLIGLFSLALGINSSHVTGEDLSSWGKRITFQASFDHGADADFAAGDKRIYTATNISRETVEAGVRSPVVALADGGKWGQCLRFSDRADQVIYFNGAENIPYAADGFDVTLAFWMRLDPDQDLKPGYVDPLQITDKAWNNSALFVDFTKDDTPRHIRLGVFSDLEFWNPQKIPWDNIAVADRPMVEVARPPFSRDKWTHVAFVLRGMNTDATVAQFYLDGKLQGQLDKPQRFTWDIEKLAVMLGIEYIGLMDDFTVFRGAMTAAEVAALAQLTESTSSLTREPTAQADAAEWIQLFNGRDLDGWQIKIRGYDLNDNFANTFRVVDGKIQVGYEGYDQFNQRYGHLFYRQPFSSYDLRVEYRFIGQQANGGEGWALRNSGIMVHGQDPGTMAKDQRFPVSIEVQLLGGNGKDPRTTANLCTPGTNVVMDGELITRHCTSSRSQTYHGDQWVSVLVRVRGNRLIEHVIDGQTVLAYTQPQLDPSDAEAKLLLATQDKLLSGGTISLQSESHPVEFRKVELRVVNE
ncbi:MAG: DUF1080 domain-containing protein [Planctomycetales bacterium]|nr:DUF1080 domain-containing protein [Planctomycetales bacterium]